MARCAFCLLETDLYDGGVPVCVTCSETREAQRNSQTRDQQIRSALLSEIVETTARTNAANEVLTSITNGIPSDLPQPDGVQRIHDASRALHAARTAMLTAHRRLNDFLCRGIVPEEMREKTEYCRNEGGVLS